MRRTVCLIALLIPLVAAAAWAAPPTTRPTTKPTYLKLTVDADDDDAQAALQLGRQLGRRVSTSGGLGGVHYRGEELPYVQAVTQFLEKTGLTFDPMSDFGLARGAPLSVVRLGDTAALFVTRVTLSAQRVLLTPQPPTYTYTLDGVLVLDPALRVMGVMPSVKADRVDVPSAISRDTGPVFDGGFGFMRAVNDSQTSAMRVSVSFASTAPVDRVPLIAGRMRAWQVAEAADAAVSFDQITDGSPVEGRGVTAAISIDDANGGPAGLWVKLTGPAAELYRDPRWQQALRRGVTALDIDGGPLALEPFFIAPRPAVAAGNGVDLRLRPAGRASDFFDQLTSVRVVVPTKLRVIDLPFEIRDLDLSPKNGPVSATGVK